MFSGRSLTEAKRHSWHPTEGISVHIAELPLDDNIRYSQHIIFLRPSDDVAATLELLRTRKTDVTTVSVLYDKGCPSESVRMAHMLSVDGPWPQSDLESCGVEGISR
ncbi:hypothetical protein AAVH_05945 [Aphelenchoides avenae]|nr:hypothetical protein AAVH_05945 [Aphelenchus avenae]